MAANNQIVIIGRLGQDPAESLRYLPSGNAVLNINVAVNRPRKDPAGNYLTDWISCSFWDKQAERLKGYAKKGGLLSVTGALQIDKWEDNGQQKQRAFIRVENFQLLGKRSDNDAATSVYDHNQQRSQGQQAPDKQRPEPDSYAEDFALDDEEYPPF